jgi:hypothetical protein
MYKVIKISGAVAIAAVAAMSLAGVSQGEPAARAAQSPDTITPIATRVSAMASTNRISADDRTAFEELSSQIGGQNGSPKMEDVDLVGARVLADNATVGRWVVAPSTAGGGFCLHVQLPNRLLPGHSSVACAPGLDADGYVLGYVNSDRLASPIVYGLVSDNVTDVQLTGASGTTVDVPVTDNVFVWSDPSVKPASIQFAERNSKASFDLASALAKN